MEGNTFVDACNIQRKEKSLIVSDNCLVVMRKYITKAGGTHFGSLWYRPSHGRKSITAGT